MSGSLCRSSAYHCVSQPRRGALIRIEEDEAVARAATRALLRVDLGDQSLDALVAALGAFFEALDQLGCARRVAARCEGAPLPAQGSTPS